MNDNMVIDIDIKANEDILKKLDSLMKTLAGTTKKTSKETDTLDKEIDGVAKTSKKLPGIKKGITGIGDGARNAVGGVKSLTGAFGSLAAAMLPVLSVAAVIAFTKKSLDAFSKFEEGMNSIFTLMPTMSKEAEEAMGVKVQGIMKKFGTTAEDTTNAVYNALSAGVPEENVFKFIDDSAKAAIAGKASLDDAASTINTIMNNYRASNLDSANVSDLLFATIKKGVTSFPELASSIGQILPTMSSANVSFEQTAATMATLTATMGKGSTAQAGTSFRAMINELDNSATKTSKIFKQLAGKDFKTFMAEGGNISQVLGKMKEHADKTGVSVADLFSSVESKKAVNILNDNKAVFEENLEEFKNVSGMTDEAFNKMNRGFGMTMNRLKANAEIAMIKFGDAIAPVVGLIGEGLMFALEGVTPVFELLGRAVEFAVQPLIDFKSAFDFIGKDADEQAKAFENLSPAIKSFIEPAKEMKAVIDNLIQPLRDMKAAFNFITNSKGKGLDEMSEMMANLSPEARKLVEPINNLMGAFDGLFRTLQESFGWVGDELQAFFDLFASGSEESGFTLEGFLGIVTGVVEALTPVIQGLGAVWESVWNVVKEVVGIAGSFVMGIMNTMGISMDDVVAVMQMLGTVAGVIFNGLATAIKSQWDIVGPILKLLAEALAVVVGWIGKITLGPLIEGAKQFNSLVGGGKEKPKSALGDTNFGGGTTVISEQGRELFATPSGMLGLSPNTRSDMSLPKGTQIFSNKKTQKILNVAKNFTTNRNQNITAQGSNVNVTIPISISSGISESKAEQIKKLVPAIKEMIEQALSDKESEKAYAWGDM